MEELIEKLQELGLSGREAEIYLALLTNRELNAPEVAKITSVTRTKTYEILQNLAKKGVCNERYKDGMKVFSSVEPTIAIGNLLSVYENELNRRRRLAEQFKDTLIELHNTKRGKNVPLDYIEVLTDIRQIRERWLTIQKNTKKELLIFTKPPYSAPLEGNVEEEAKLLKDKIVDKSIYEFNNINSAEEINNLVATIETYQKIGEDARIIKELPMKLAISDETITMLALNDRISMEPSITTMIIDHPKFAKAQKKVFESYWNEASTIEEFKRNLIK